MILYLNEKRLLMKIAITGVPTVGKTTVAKRLSRRLGYKLVSINDLAEKLKAYVGYDKKRESKILDMDKLRQEIKKMKGNMILDGHTSHEFDVNLVIVLRCNPTVLQKRLEKKYPKNPFKVQENVDAELLGVITSDALKYNERVYEIDTTNMSIRNVVDAAVDIVKGKKGYEVGKIEWLE